MKELQAIVRAVASCPQAGAVLATLVRVEGSSYRRPGARLLLLPDGTRIGSISGGCLEGDLLERARRVAASGVADTVVYDTTSENDVVWGVGLGCHGIVRVLIEPLPPHPAWTARVLENLMARRSTRIAVTHRGPGSLGTALAGPASTNTDAEWVQEIPPPTKLVVFGAGDDAQPLVRLATGLGWVVVVADPRPAFAVPDRFPEAESVIVGPTDDLVARAKLDDNSVAVVMTHHYVHDVPLLQSLLPSPAAYLGLLGPRKRAEKILSDLAQAGVAISATQRERLHAPVGLDLGADGPEQVALAVIAEIQAVLNGRDARPLRDRHAPIHASDGSLPSSHETAESHPERKRDPGEAPAARTGEWNP